MPSVITDGPDMKAVGAFILRSIAAIGKRTNQAVKFSMFRRRICRQPRTCSRRQTKIGAEAINQKRRLVRNADQRVGDRNLAALAGARDDQRWF